MAEIKHKKSSVFIKVTLIIIIALINLGISKVAISYRDYKEAISLYEKGDYDEAISLFNKLNGFLDSEEILLKTKYEKAVNLLEFEEYDEAISSLEMLVGYLDSNEILLEAKYLKAMKIYTRDFDEGISIFKELNDYKDSIEMVKECLYMKAENYEKMIEWQLAIDTMSMIPDYKDSKELISKYKYNYALEKAENKEWTSAIQLLEPLENIRNKDELLGEFKYNVALEKYRLNDWSSAIEILSSIINYKYSEELIYQSNINQKLNIQPILPEIAEAPDTPSKINDLMQVYKYMATKDIFQYTVEYYGVYSIAYFKQILQNLEISLIKVLNEDIDNFSFINQYSITDSSNDYVVIDLSSDEISNKDIIDYNRKFRLESYKIIDKLIDDGMIIEGMTQKEMAQVLYKWVVNNVEYDYNLKSLSFTGYGAAVNKKAVCQGYTALYNLLCKIVGIETIGVVGDAENFSDDFLHIWTLAVLDGQKAFIDATWGDGGNYCDMNYFMASEEFLSESHTWDKDTYNLK